MATNKKHPKKDTGKKKRNFKGVRKPKGTDITKKEIRDFKKKVKSGEIKIESRYLKKSKIGRERIFAEPEDMLQAAEEYFHFVDTTPFENWEWKNTATGLRKVAVPVRRPYSVGGMMLYFGTTYTYLLEFKKARMAEANNPNKSEEERAKAVHFTSIIQWIESCVREQKFDGAAVGHFNANIISRDLGLIDKTENVNITKQEIAEVFPDELTSNVKEDEKKG
jgi:hypothetical protein